MTDDAKFADGIGQPLRLLAADLDDLQVISSLVQDAVFVGEDVSWQTSKRRFAMLLNRFRWEDRVAQKHPERVRSVLVIDDVIAVRSQGFDHRTKDIILSVLSVSWQANEDGSGQVLLTLAGDGALAIEADCINVTLRDVTRPYVAPSGKRPEHPDE